MYGAWKTGWRSSKGRGNTKDTSNHLRLAFPPKTDREMGGCFTDCQKTPWDRLWTCSNGVPFVLTSDIWLSTICMLSYRYLPNTSQGTTEMSCLWWKCSILASSIKVFKVDSNLMLSECCIFSRVQWLAEKNKRQQLQWHALTVISSISRKNRI